MRIERTEPRERSTRRLPFSPLSASLRVIALLTIAIVGAGMGWVATAKPALAAPVVQSSARQATAEHYAQNTSVSAHVTAIVLDMSGSMSVNDPGGVRCSAADAYIDLSGPGDYIGVIGLDNNGDARGGPHNFETSQVWAAPTEMATHAQRTGLEDAIASKSNNCAPDNSTPTYDALNQALTMLRNATHNGQISGSVILLTDGVPAPDTNQQIATIKSDLVPQFQKNNWPVDTIALGQGQDFSFLNDIANATSGGFYDDTQGDASSNGTPTPLNIAPYFVRIFAQRNHRTPGPTVAATAIYNGGTERDFQVGDYVNHLDIVAIKDDPNTRITLAAPSGEQISPTTAGATYSADRYNHYVIYSIDGPQKGHWTFTITGSGSFLMDSLVTSSLGVNILTPTSNAPAQALGQPLNISAQIIDQSQAGGAQVNSPDFTVRVKITYAGQLPYGVAPFTQDVVLNNNAGSYQGMLNVPVSAPAGSYQVQVSAYGSTSTPIAVDSRSIRLELFPAPCFASCGIVGVPPGVQVRASAVQWDPLTQAVYGLPVGLMDWLSQWPLAGLPAHTSARLNGQIYLKGSIYRDAKVASVSATRLDASGKKVSTPVALFNDGNGAFHLILPYTGPGIYTLNILTAGAFGQTHGDLGATKIDTQYSVMPATFVQEARDAGISLFYILLMIFIVLLIRMALLPKPFGQLQLANSDGGILGDGPSVEEFALVRRGLWNRLVHPNKIWASEMGMHPGLVFIFDHLGHIRASSHNYSLGGTPMRGTADVEGQTLKEPSAEGSIYKVLGKSSIEVNTPDPWGGTAQTYEYEQDEAEKQPGDPRGFLQGLGAWLSPGRNRGRNGDTDANDDPSGLNDDPFGLNDEGVRTGRRKNRRQHVPDDPFTF